MFSAAPTPRRVLPPTAGPSVPDPAAPAADARGEGPRAVGRTGTETARPAARDGGDAAGSGRNAFFDNAKYLAIVLVAMGHSWEPLTGQSRTAGALYMTVYAFHMPAFIIISGYFSRGFDLRPDRLRRLITGVVVPYLVFETAYTLFARWAYDDPDMPVSLLDPWYLTWFLAALFVWRLTTPLWRIIRWPVPLALALAVLASVSPEVGDDSTCNGCSSSCRSSSWDCTCGPSTSRSYGGGRHGSRQCPSSRPPWRWPTGRYRG